MPNLKVLIVDDEENTLQALKMGLNVNGYEILTEVSRNDAINLLKKEDIDIVITDLKLKDGSGLDILSYIQENNNRIPVIIITAHGSVESAIEAIRSGAYDYLVKPFRLADLKKLLTRLSETILLRRENEQLKSQLRPETGMIQLIGVNQRFKRIIEFIRQIASSRSTVLITGETGTGKEVAANAIHFYSQRSAKSFVKINCGAIPETLLEAELFGYERGAFTGAVKQKKGKIELANDGTLFLDEIGELSPSMQVKLLRVLQNGEFERLGDTVTQKVDVRFIAATNVSLKERVSLGTFREDLYYRLNVMTIQMPSLRERLDDIPYLVQYFIEKYNNINSKSVQGVTPEVIKQMMRYPWRGNIRELENMIERAVVLCQNDFLKAEHFPMLLEDIDDAQRMIKFEVGHTLSEIEKSVIQRTLLYYQYDKQKTAMTLQISLATLYRKIKEYGLE
ncbi:MAG: sigma-54-dependent transcriptional regulator [Calditrichaceae bacterium]